MSNIKYQYITNPYNEILRSIHVFINSAYKFLLYFISILPYKIYVYLFTKFLAINFARVKDGKTLKNYETSVKLLLRYHFEGKGYFLLLCIVYHPWKICVCFPSKGGNREIAYLAEIFLFLFSKALNHIRGAADGKLT